jgi:hypothetical protein
LILQFSRLDSQILSRYVMRKLSILSSIGSLHYAFVGVEASNVEEIRPLLMDNIDYWEARTRLWVM